MRPKPLKRTNNHHLKICINLRKHYSYHRMRNFQIFLLCLIMKEIKPSRHQNNVHHPEHCSCFYNRKTASDYTVGQKDIWKKKEQDFQAKGGRISGYYWKPNLLTFFLNGKAIRDARHLRKNTVYCCFSKYLWNRQGYVLQNKSC